MGTGFDCLGLNSHIRRASTQAKQEIEAKGEVDHAGDETACQVWTCRRRSQGEMTQLWRSGAAPGISFGGQTLKRWEIKTVL